MTRYFSKKQYEIAEQLQPHMQTLLSLWELFERLLDAVRSDPLKYEVDAEGNMICSTVDDPKAAEQCSALGEYGVKLRVANGAIWSDLLVEEVYAAITQIAKKFIELYPEYADNQHELFRLIFIEGARYENIAIYLDQLGAPGSSGTDKCSGAAMCTIGGAGQLWIFNGGQALGDQQDFITRYLVTHEMMHILARRIADNRGGYYPPSVNTQLTELTNGRISQIAYSFYPSDKVNLPAELNNWGLKANEIDCTNKTPEECEAAKAAALDERGTEMLNLWLWDDENFASPVFPEFEGNPLGYSNEDDEHRSKANEMVTFFEQNIPIWLQNLVSQ